MSNYYCLMAGLPVMKLADAKPARTLLELKQQLHDEATGRDRRLVDDYFLRFDCQNLVAVLDDAARQAEQPADAPATQAQLDPRGNMDREELSRIIAEAQQTEGPVEGVPPFVADFVRTYRERNGQEGWFARDAVLLAYYDYASTSPSPMLADWYTLNLNILNILTALIARRQGWPLAAYVQGRGPVAEAILKQGAQPDFGLSAELDYVPALIRAAETTDPVEKERQIDALRWQWLEERTFFEPFDITAVMAYVARTEILERWAQLDPEQGRERFTQIIEDLRGNARVPAEFVRK